MSRLDKLTNRRNPLRYDRALASTYSANQQAILTAAEAYERAKEGDAIRYLIGSMQPINPEYTGNTYQQAERVKNHLSRGLPQYNLAAEYTYQGSVTNDTHIKAYSDIDLLVLDHRFYMVASPHVPTSAYRGDPVANLMELRNASVRIIRDSFSEVTVDTTGSKSVSLTGGSLSRKVDVVISNWWDTCEYCTTKLPAYRGVHILDWTIPRQIPNMPFLHNARIDDKDRATYGGYRKAVRLLKSLKYDRDPEADISSYDICSIVYNMPDHCLPGQRGYEIQLAQRCREYLNELECDSQMRSKLQVPNGMRLVFCDNGATEKGLRELNAELGQLMVDVKHDLARSFRKLEAARVEY